MDGYHHCPACGKISPVSEAVEFYLEAAQAAIIQLAQDLEAQEAGFKDKDELLKFA